jgi:hypothetical protein
VVLFDFLNSGLIRPDLFQINLTFAEPTSIITPTVVASLSDPLETFSQPAVWLAPPLRFPSTPPEVAMPGNDLLVNFPITTIDW